MRYFSSLFFFFALFFLFLVLPATSYADTNFDTDYSVVYTVSEDSNTHAAFSVKLTNTTRDYYASSYKIQLGFNTITNVVARDDGGNIKPVITKSEDGQNVLLNFNERVVGEGKALRFTLEFDTPDVTKQNGSVWEINIPGIKNKEDFTKFTAEVKVPDAFGKPTYIKPQQSNNSLIFSKEQLETSGISIAFGEKQYYHFNLVYHLKNTNVFPIKTEIALPPTTNYQEVTIDDIQPKPANVYIDQDGNWLAEYTLLPSQKKNVVAKGRAILSLDPKPVPLTETEQALYLQEKPYWQVNDKKIATLAQELKTPEAIYNYVVKALSYNFNRISTGQDRIGALSVLDRPSEAVCREFTDLFVALARAAGIPAREVNGYAYTENAKQRPLSLVNDVLHAWPEYYDFEKGSWIMVDPTWGNTTGGVDYFKVLDFDHLVFVIKGADSEYPIPAGGYKFSGDENKKDVTITFGEAFETAPYQLSLRSDIAKSYLSFLPVQATVYIKNTGKTVIPDEKLGVITRKLSPTNQVIPLKPIPPYGEVAIPIEFAKNAFLTNTTDTLTMRISNRSLSKEIRIAPILFTTEIIIGGIVIVLFTLIVLIIAFKAWRLPFLR